MDVGVVIQDEMRGLPGNTGGQLDTKLVHTVYRDESTFLALMSSAPTILKLLSGETHFCKIEGEGLVRACLGIIGYLSLTRQKGSA
jgi:hypothetical protein